MNETKQENTGAETLLATWLKTTTEFWGSMARTWANRPDTSAASDTAAASEKEAAERAQESLQSALKTWMALSSVMSDPEALESQLKGVHGLPEVLSRLVQSGWDGYFQLQQQWLQRAERIGKTTEAYKFENLDQNAFALWNDLYEKEFRQFLHLPPAGANPLLSGKSRPGSRRIQHFPGQSSRISAYLLPAHGEVTQSYAGKANGNGGSR